VPNVTGYSLYIRPAGISMNVSLIIVIVNEVQDALGVRQPTRSKIFVVATPVGGYFPNESKPLKLYAEKVFVRAYPGGVGQHQLGA